MEIGGQSPGQVRIDMPTDIVSHTDTWINQVLTNLGWTEDHIIQKDEMLTCPVDSSHIIHASDFCKHRHYCPLQRRGYTKRQLDEEESHSSKFFYEKAESVVTIETDAATMERILSRTGTSSATGALPLTMERAVTDLTAHQKSAIYDYCIECARATNKPTSIPLDDLELLDETNTFGEQPLSEMELKQQHRDMKRRRQSYRKKNIHTGKKSYLQVIHEVIEQQTGLLANKWRIEETQDSTVKQKNKGDKSHDGTEGTPDRAQRLPVRTERPPNETTSSLERKDDCTDITGGLRSSVVEARLESPSRISHKHKKHKSKRC